MGKVSCAGETMKIGYFVSVFVCRQTLAGPEFLQLLRAEFAPKRQGQFTDPGRRETDGSVQADQGHLSDPASRVPNYMGFTWQLVTGKIKDGEKAYEAALRELLEETGLRPVEYYQVDRVNTFYLALNDSLNHVPMFVAIVDKNAAVRLNPEHTDHRWLDRNVFAGQLMWPGEREAFAEVCREILDDGPAKKHLRIQLNDQRAQLDP